MRYTKTLTTPHDLSRCLYDGLPKVSELAYSEPRLAAWLPLWDRHGHVGTMVQRSLCER